MSKKQQNEVLETNTDVVEMAQIEVEDCTPTVLIRPKIRHTVAVFDSTKADASIIAWLNDTNWTKAKAVDDEWFELEHGGFSRQKYYDISAM